jgi:outer membrane murein-binding lipoprotein Lpp
VNSTHCSADEYAYFAVGNLEGPGNELLREHLRDNCELCVAEIREALEFWYVFAALTERTQAVNSCEPTPMLRDRVIGIARGGGMRPARRTSFQTTVQTWLRVAAGILVVAGAGSLSWSIGRSHIKRDISEVQARIEQQTSTVRKLESENNALRNLVVAARNAPAVFPGRDSIVSVQDPYLLRDLQQARQTQVAISAALNDERAKAAELEKRLSKTTTLLAVATHQREEADRQYRKAYDAATLEKERGANQLSTEINTYNTKVQDLESQIGRYRIVIDAQNKRIEQHQQMVALLQSHNLAVVQLRSMLADQGVSGVALIADDSRLALFPANLPAAAAGRTYQLWLIRDKGPVNAGTFNGTAKDMPTLQFANKQLLNGIKSLVVTDEPIGGSPQPTGHKILIGTAPKG